jgi:hypothetical protein
MKKRQAKKNAKRDAGLHDDFLVEFRFWPYGDTKYRRDQNTSSFMEERFSVDKTSTRRRDR